MFRHDFKPKKEFGVFVPVLSPPSLTKEQAVLKRHGLWDSLSRDPPTTKRQRTQSTTYLQSHSFYVQPQPSQTSLTGRGSVKAEDAKKPVASDVRDSHKHSKRSAMTSLPLKPPRLVKEQLDKAINLTVPKSTGLQSAQPSKSSDSSGKHGLPFDLVYRGQKGFGLVAIRDIRKGEVIISEKPFIKFTHPVAAVHIREVFAGLEETARILFLSFNATIEDEPDLFINIAETNGIPMQEPDDWDDDSDGSSGDVLIKAEAIVKPEEIPKIEQDLTYGHNVKPKMDSDIKPKLIGNAAISPNESSVPAGIFEYISRANHSCCPNSEWVWDEDEGKLDLRAHTNIQASTEITVSYRDTQLWSQPDRAADLKRTFGFDCKCQPCAAPPAEIARADTQLKTLRKIYDKWISTDVVDYGFDRREALAEIRYGIGIAKAECKYEAVARGLAEEFYLWASWAKRREAIKAARKAGRAYADLYGEKRVAKMGFEVWKKKPWMYEGWGVCLEANGGDSSEDSSDSEGHWRQKGHADTNQPTKSNSKGLQSTVKWK